MSNKSKLEVLKLTADDILPATNHEYTYYFYMADGGKKTVIGTEPVVMEMFVNDKNAAFFVKANEDPNFIWRGNVWVVDERKGDG